MRRSAERASIAVYGHSHEPVAEYCKGVLMLNPGSTSWPRQENRKPSYIVLTLEGGKPRHPMRSAIWIRTCSKQISFQKKFKNHVDNLDASTYNNTCI